MNKEQQIIEIKECIDTVYGADCAYYYVDGFAIANEIYNADYRKQEWIRVEDRLPINPTIEEEEYIVMLDRAYIPTFAAFDGEKFYRCNCTSFDSKVTHWMPLPEPPEKKGETE